MIRLATCAALLLCGCGESDSGWEVVLDSDGLYDISVSRTRVQPLGGDACRVWLREEWPAGLVDEGQPRMKVGLADFDCRARRSRLIVPAVAERDFAKVEQALLPTADQQPWTGHAQGTGGQQILDAVCAWIREDAAADRDGQNGGANG